MESMERLSAEWRMDDIEFDEPVELMTDNPRVQIKVATAGDAIRALLKGWPVSGPKHYAAQQAIHDLLIGKASPTEAREAFEHAADEAEIRIGGNHPKNPIAAFLAKHRRTTGVPIPIPKKRR